MVLRPLRRLLPQEYIPRGVEAGRVDAAVAGVVPVRQDAAGEARDGALEHFVVARLVARHRVHHHEVDRRLRRSTDLKHIRIGILCILDNDGLAAAQRIGYGVLVGVEDGFGAVRRLDHVVLGAAHAVSGRAPVQHKLAAPPAAVAGWQVSVVAKYDKLAILDGRFWFLLRATLCGFLQYRRVRAICSPFYDHDRVRILSRRTYDLVSFLTTNTDKNKHFYSK